MLDALGDFPSVCGEEEVDGVVVLVGGAAEVVIYELPDGCGPVWNWGLGSCCSN